MSRHRLSRPQCNVVMGITRDEGGKVSMNPLGIRSCCACLVPSCSQASVCRPPTYRGAAAGSKQYCHRQTERSLAPYPQSEHGAFADECTHFHRLMLGLITVSVYGVCEAGSATSVAVV